MIRMRISMHPSVIRSKGRALSSPKGLGESPKGGNLALLSVVRHYKSVEWCSWMLNTLLCSGAFWTLFLWFFLSDPCSQTCFHPQSMIFISFLDNSGFFRNNYLVEKYPKINFDKVQIIHNFIVIQSSLFFLCMQSYFKQ